MKVSVKYAYTNYMHEIALVSVVASRSSSLAYNMYMYMYKKYMYVHATIM